MSEAMDQPTGGPGHPRPGAGDDGSMEPSTCQELLHRLRELEVCGGSRWDGSAGQSPVRAGLPLCLSLVQAMGAGGLPQPPWPG
jgi:hypothetical protein